MRSLQDQPAYRSDKYKSRSKVKEADSRPRTVYAATNGEEVEEFALTGWPAGNASQPVTGFWAFAETR